MTSPSTVWMRESSEPMLAITSRASATEIPGAMTSKVVPPSKSMPRFRPRTPNEPMLSTIATSDTVTALRHQRG